MKSPKLILVGIMMTFGQACIHADEADVYDRMVREAARPMTFEDAKAADRNLEAFRTAMAHVPRPWTFEKLRQEYQAAVWPDDAPGKPDDDWEARYRRMRLFISLMAETRDPRASIVLLDALTYPHTDLRRYVADTLAANFLDDPHYEQVPRPPQVLKVGKVNLRETEERVREWWSVNEAAVRRDAAATQ